MINVASKIIKQEDTLQKPKNSKLEKHAKFVEDLNSDTLVKVEQMKERLANEILKAYNVCDKNHMIKQKKFAAILGTTQPRISNIINKKLDNFSLELLLKFCFLLGISVDFNIDNFTSELPSKTTKLIRAKTVLLKHNNEFEGV